MTTRLTTSGIIFNDSTSQSTQGVEFASGTLMLFQQTSAPVGWTKETTHNNKSLRVVSGTAGSGGSVPFTTAFSSKILSATIGSTTLSTSQMPSHTHTPGVVGGGGAFGNSYTNASSDAKGINPGDTGPVLNYTGSSGSHSHSFTGTAIDMNVEYVDLIIASKN